MFGKKNHVDIELNADVERLLKSARDGVLPIVEAGEPVLREQCVRYDGQLSKHTLHKLIETMHKTMLDAPGVGLAGPQIGLNLAIAVVEDHANGDDDGDPREIAEFPFHAIINPVYRPAGEKTRSFYEGCLSFDGWAVRKRYLDIIAHWHDEDGKEHEEHLHGWPARIFQHETDHLSGELYIDQAGDPLAHHGRESRGLLGTGSGAHAGCQGAWLRAVRKRLSTGLSTYGGRSRFVIHRCTNAPRYPQRLPVLHNRA